MESRPPTSPKKEKALLGADVPGWYSREWLDPGDNPFIPRGAEPKYLSTVIVTRPAPDDVPEMGGL